MNIVIKVTETKLNKHLFLIQKDYEDLKDSAKCWFRKIAFEEGEVKSRH